jgi:hypothetical protein
MQKKASLRDRLIENRVRPPENWLAMGLINDCHEDRFYIERKDNLVVLAERQLFVPRTQ